jgi:hypothetical protein
MPQMPFILADSSPLIGVIFLVIWGILSLMSVANKKKKQQQQQQPLEIEDEIEFEVPEVEWPRRREPVESQPQPLPPIIEAPPKRTFPSRRAQLPPMRAEMPPKRVQPPARRPEVKPRVELSQRVPRRTEKARRPQPSPARAPLGEETLGASVFSSEVSRSEIGSAPEVVSHARSERARRLASLLTPHSAREAILLSEVIGQPVALRSRDARGLV